MSFPYVSQTCKCLWRTGAKLCFAPFFFTARMSEQMLIYQHFRAIQLPHIGHLAKQGLREQTRGVTAMLCG